MKTFLALALLLAVAVPASACNHVPAQALLQGLTCPTCGATAQSVVQYQQQAVQQQAVVQYQVQQPVVAYQRLVVQQPVQVVQQRVQYQQAIVQPVIQQSVIQYQRQGLLGGLNLNLNHRGFFGRQRSLNFSSY